VKFTSRRPLAALAIAGSLVAALVVGCTGDDESSDPTIVITAGTPASQVTAAASVEATASPEAPAATAEPTTAASAQPASGDTLSANDASIAELAARFEAAGIAQPALWAREVDEYRPYSADDTDYNKLRGELAKYNPGPGVVDAIITTLHLP
jgi:hypothetical protein